MIWVSIWDAKTSIDHLWWSYHWITLSDLKLHYAALSHSLKPHMWIEGYRPNVLMANGFGVLSVTNVARVRGDPPLLQSAMDILWRLRFSRLRQAPSRKAWYSRGPVKSKIIASYVHENVYLWYFILPQIMVFPRSINITARLACTNNHTCSTDSLARLIIGFKSRK